MLTSLHFTIALCVWMAVFDLKRIWYQSIWVNMSVEWLQNRLCSQSDAAKAKCASMCWFLSSERRLDKIKHLTSHKEFSFLKCPLRLVHFVFDVVIIHADAIMAVCVFAILSCLDTPVIFDAFGGKIGGAYAPMPWCDVTADGNQAVDPCPGDARYWKQDWELGWMITMLVISILTVFTLGHPIPMALDILSKFVWKSKKISFWKAARDNTMSDTSAGSWKQSLTPRERRASLSEFAAPSVRLDAADLPDYGTDDAVDSGVPMMPMLKSPAAAGSVGDDAAEFARLASLRDAGALTEEEYTVAVQKVAGASYEGALDETSVAAVQEGVVVGVVRASACGDVIAGTNPCLVYSGAVHAV